MQNSESVNVNLSEESAELAEALKSFEDSINLSKIALTMQNVLKGSPLFDYRMLTHTLLLPVFDHQFNESDTYKQHEQCLITAWGKHRCKRQVMETVVSTFSLITNAIEIKEHY